VAPQTSTPGRAARRPDVSMSLINDLTTNSLDQAYVERASAREAARRSAESTGGAAPVRTPGRVAVGALLLVALGVLTGTAIGQVRERAGASTGVRADLEAEVRQRTAETDQRAAEVEQLRREQVAERERALSRDTAGRSAAAELRTLGAAAGTVAVGGPGLVVTVDDAPAGSRTDEGRGGAFGEGRVLDRDLQDLVNALWAAGAEAVAVNGLRLTSLSAIRSAGQAVLVDFRPVSPPYVVEAVGDPAALELQLLDGPTGRRFATWSQLYGLGFEARREERLELPAATVSDLRVARPVPAEAGRS
jgi:uncharacterized protein YlxW (UPF0749 family)